MIVYPSDVELNIVFDYIAEHSWDYDGAMVDYRIDSERIERLKTVLVLSQNDEYYPNIYDKAAYIFTALITGHYFQNGNKRLAVHVTFLLFVMNDYMFTSILTKSQKGKLLPMAMRIIRKVDNDSRLKIIQHGLIYALALYIANGKHSFDYFKKDAHKLFSIIIKPV